MNRDEVILEMSGSKLDKKDFIGKSDPFLEIHKLTDTGNYTLVYKTDVSQLHQLYDFMKCIPNYCYQIIKNTTKPHWKKFSIPVRQLCNDDYELDLKIICFDWNLNGSHSLIGEFHTTLKGLSDSNASFTCINGKKKVNYCLCIVDFQYFCSALNIFQEKKKDYRGSGTIRVDSIKIQTNYTFLDYVQGGTEIFCTVAIDFTGEMS